MSIYREYAHVYDRSGQLGFSLRMIPYLRELLARHAPPVVPPHPDAALLELACGTGTVALAMAQGGWRVYAVDGSADMLDEARAKAATCDAVPIFSQQDMRSLVLPERVPLATCLYDSINYMLASEDLLAAFRSVYRVLRPGGIFLFDMNTAWVMATHWDGNTYYTGDDDLAVIMCNDYDSAHQRVTVEVTCFQRVAPQASPGDGTTALYRKFVEQHVEQAYPAEQVATLLNDAGFALEASYDCLSFRPVCATTGRILWVARRP